MGLETIELLSAEPSVLRSACKAVLAIRSFGELLDLILQTASPQTLIENWRMQPRLRTR